MNNNKHAIIDPVDSRTTLTIVKEMLSWSDDQWKSHEANLSTEQKLEMRQELEDLGELFGKMKSHDYNWRKAVLVCLPEKYLGVLQEHFLAAGAGLHAPNESLKSFAQYCSHKNLLEHFYADDGEQAPSSVSHSLTSKHAELREIFVADLYKGLAKVLKNRGETASTTLKSLFWIDSDDKALQEVSYKSHSWKRMLQEIGPYAYLLREPASALARDTVGARVTTFIRQISAENGLNKCPPDQLCRQVLGCIPVQCTPAPTADGESTLETSLHALLLQNIGLNRAYLEYSAHYLDILDYAPTLVKAIEFYEKIGMRIENDYVDSLGTRGVFDLPVFLMMVVSRMLRQPDIEPAVAKRGFSMTQCASAIALAQDAVSTDESAKKLLVRVFHERGEDAANSVTLHLVSMSAFCFIWFFLHNQQVNARVYGRKHSGHSLLGDSLNRPFAELQESQQNLLKHIVMAVNRSGQLFEINADHMDNYLLARAFNLVTLTAKVAAIKRMDLHGFGRWAQSIQFSDYLAKDIGESVMVDLPAAGIEIVLA